MTLAPDLPDGGLLLSCVTRRNGWFALFAVLAASCKEEMGLLVLMLGLYALLAQRRVRLA